MRNLLIGKYLGEDLWLHDAKAAQVTDHILIPVETNNLSFRGVEMLFKNVAKIQARLNPKLSVLGVLPTKYNPRYTHDNEVLAVVRERLAQQGIEG